MTGHVCNQLRRPPQLVVPGYGLGSALKLSLCGSPPRRSFSATEFRADQAVWDPRFQNRRGSTRPGPTPSQLLRFALTKDVRHPQHQFGQSYTDTLLDEIFLNEWPVNLTPTPLWAPHPVDNPFRDRKVLGRLMSEARSLERLKNFIRLGILTSEENQPIFHEKVQSTVARAFKLCEQQNTYGEILAYINGLTVRLKNFLSNDRHFLHYLGIYYGCLLFSDSAVEYHLRAWSRDRPLGLEASHRIVRALLRSLHALSFDDPKRDTSKMLRLVTGEDGSTNPSLHRVLYWSKGMPTNVTATVAYLSLLAHARSDTVRQEVWSNLSKVIGEEPAGQKLEKIYNYAQTLVVTGDSSGALSTLKQLSKIAENTLPAINQSKALGSFLRVDKICEELPQLAGKQEYLKILAVQLLQIERSLGIEWQSETSEHSAIAEPFRIASEQPLFTIDGDSSGFQNPQKLIEGIRTLGLSKSLADLSKIGDLLDDYDGDLIPITLDSRLPTTGKIYWAPHREHVKFYARSPSELDSQREETLTNLGLVKLNASRDGQYLPSQGSLHLLQLGSLVTLQREDQAGGKSKLKELGYLVTWDRVSEVFLVIYCGVDRKPVSPTTAIQSSKAPSGLRAIMGMGSFHHHKQRWDIRFPEYTLELDPSPDLILDVL
ncbi:hypothetical protein BJX70DRAFT_153987 [Aspergillus crustosus]